MPHYYGRVQYQMRYNTEYTDRYRTATRQYVMAQRTNMDRTDIGTDEANYHGIMTQPAWWLRVETRVAERKNWTKGIPINSTDKADENIAMESLLLGKWLTCTVIGRQPTSLRLIDQSTAYLPV